MLVAFGRGIGGPENIPVVEALAKALGGEVAATRAVVDAGWMPYSMQVGQTGKTVSPKLYVACGISGAIQHKVGMVNSGPDRRHQQGRQRADLRVRRPGRGRRRADGDAQADRGAAGAADGASRDQLCKQPRPSRQPTELPGGRQTDDGRSSHSGGRERDVRRHELLEQLPARESTRGAGGGARAEHAPAATCSPTSTSAREEAEERLTALDRGAAAPPVSTPAARSATPIRCRRSRMPCSSSTPTRS